MARQSEINTFAQRLKELGFRNIKVEFENVQPAKAGRRIIDPRQNGLEFEDVEAQAEIKRREIIIFDGDDEAGWFALMASIELNYELTTLCREWHLWVDTPPDNTETLEALSSLRFTSRWKIIFERKYK